MRTLKKYFAKGSGWISAGKLLTCKTTGRLYVLANQLASLCLVDVVTGLTIKKVPSKKGVIDERLTMQLLQDVADSREDTLICWYCISNQEAIGKFAAILLSK